MNRLIFYLSLLCACTRLGAEDPGRDIVLVGVKWEQYAVEYRIAEPKYRALSAWTPDVNPSPPLDMQAAVLIARTHLQLLLPHVSSFHLRQVSLTRAEDSRLFRYFYRVEFSDPKGLCASGSDRLECVVFLDGATLDPQPVRK